MSGEQGSSGKQSFTASDISLERRAVMFCVRLGMTPKMSKENLEEAYRKENCLPLSDLQVA
jgi:hypothetical protein